MPDGLQNHFAASRVAGESPLIKWTFVSIGLAFALVFLLLPLVNVFCQALPKAPDIFCIHLPMPIAVLPSVSRC